MNCPVQKPSNHLYHEYELRMVAVEVPMKNGAEGCWKADYVQHGTTWPPRLQLGLVGVDVMTYDHSLDLQRLDGRKIRISKTGHRPGPRLRRDGHRQRQGFGTAAQLVRLQVLSCNRWAI